jgi:glycosyltransferase involved in cell wall biosynthesis
MKLSIFTPTNNIQWLDLPYQSISKQIDLDLNLDVEWIIVPNNNVEIPSEIQNKRWVRVVRCSSELKNIGALKHFACEQATGDVFIELDHDDELLPGSLRRIHDEMKDKPNSFLYSDKTVKRHDNKPQIYGHVWGWEHYNWNDQIINKGFLPDARSLCQIFYAPDHVRVWSRESYKLSGGHDKSLFVGDDHDLVIRTYLAGSEFIFIQEPLYNYFIHGNNSWLQNCDKVQKQQHNNTEKHLRPLIKEWCRRENLSIINYPSEKFTEAQPNSIGCIIANDVIASISAGASVIEFMNKCYELLVPGGWLQIDVPSTDGRGAFCDPMHVSFWNELSFRYYTNKNFSKFIPQYKGRFQQVILKTHMPSKWHQDNNVPYVRSDMCAIKKNHRLAGYCYI